MVDNETKKSNVVLIVIIGVIVFIAIILSLLFIVKTFSGSRVYTKEEQIAINKTIKYIEEKYNFTPTIKSIKEDTSYGGLFIHEKNGNYNIICSDGKKTFKVYEQGYNIDDNYQMDEISKDIKKYVEAKTNAQVINIYMLYGTITGEHDRDGLINYYYTSGNLKELFDNEPCSISVETINAQDMSGLKYDSTIQSAYRFSMVNYRSEDAYSKANTHNYTGGYGDISIKENAVLIKDAYIKDKQENMNEEYHDLKVETYDFFKYYSSKGNNSNIKISVTKDENITNWVGRGACSNVKALSKTYKIENYSTDEELYIYIPKKYIKDIKRTSIGIHSYDSYETSNISKVSGDYYPVEIDTTAREFTIVLLYSKC